MTNAAHEAAQSRSAQICELADDMGEFSLSDLAAYARSEGVYAQIKLDSLMDRGVIADVKAIIKRQTDNDGLQVFVAISTGPGALWKPWARCTRVESRMSLQILARSTKHADKSMQRLKEAHEKRFREDLTLPKLSSPRDWDPDDDVPPVHRWEKNDPRR
jgi:hypothetical protein